jgi:hypothetical protein
MNSQILSRFLNSCQFEWQESVHKKAAEMVDDLIVMDVEERLEYNKMFILFCGQNLIDS